MTAKLKKLFPTKNAYKASKTDVSNAHGVEAFRRGLEEQAVQVMMVGNLEGTFYATAKKLSRECIDVLTSMAEKDSEFLAKAIVYARNNGYMRLTPIMGLLILSKQDPQSFRKIFDRVILQPGDLQDFMTLVRSKTVRSTGKSVREAVGSWLNKISPYHVIKYGAPQKKPGAGSPLNLRDILRLVHAKPKGEAGAIFSYIVKRIKGEKIDSDLFEVLPEQLQAYEKFKDLTATTEKAKENSKKALELVSEHTLPYEVVAGRLSSPAAWKVLAEKAPFMNMLRNLNNYEKNGVFKDEELTDKVISRLRSKEQIAKSKQFPFRFFSAYKNFSGEPDVRNALVDALDLSVENLPDMGRTLIAVDESGSMDSPISNRSSVTIREIGNIFAAALYRRSSRSYLVPFTTEAYPVGISNSEYQANKRAHSGKHGAHYDVWVDRSYSALGKVNSRDSVVTTAGNLAGVNGGTDLSAPLDWALKGNRKFDTGIFITDSESWHDHLYRGHGVLDSIRRFRGKNPKAQFFFLQLAPYREVQVPKAEPGVHFIYGWSDTVLKYIGQIVAGGKGQVDEIRGLDLDKFSREKPSLK
jgi:60 kDa SS-A/Ro ribonucleoprotein